MRLDSRRILAAVAGFFITACFTPHLTGQTNYVAHSTWSASPAIEDFPIGFQEGVEHLHLKHWQHEQVEQIVASEAIQLAQTGSNDDLSVARRFQQEQAIRAGARQRIASILTPRQRQEVSEEVVRRLRRAQHQWDDL